MGRTSPRRLTPQTASVLLGSSCWADARGLFRRPDRGDPAGKANTPRVDDSVGSMVPDDVCLGAARTVAAGGSVTLRGAFTDESPQPDRLIGVTTPAATAVALLAPDGTRPRQASRCPATGRWMPRPGLGSSGSPDR